MTLSWLVLLSPTFDVGACLFMSRYAYISLYVAS